MSPSHVPALPLRNSAQEAGRDLSASGLRKLIFLKAEFCATCVPFCRANFSSGFVILKNLPDRSGTRTDVDVLREFCPL